MAAGFQHREVRQSQKRIVPIDVAQGHQGSGRVPADLQVFHPRGDDAPFMGPDLALEPEPLVVVRIRLHATLPGQVVDRFPSVREEVLGPLDVRQREHFHGFFR